MRNLIINSVAVVLALFCAWVAYAVPSVATAFNLVAGSLLGLCLPALTRILAFFGSAKTAVDTKTHSSYASKGSSSISMLGWLAAMVGAVIVTMLFFATCVGVTHADELAPSPCYQDGNVVSCKAPSVLEKTALALANDAPLALQKLSFLVYKYGKTTFQPSFAAAAGQINLREALDNGIGNAYQRVSLLAGYGFTYHGDAFVTGASVYAGVGLAASQPNAPQVNLLWTLWDRFGVGPGFVTFIDGSGTRRFQALLSFAVNSSIGGTTSDMLNTFEQAIKTSGL